MHTCLHVSSRLWDISLFGSLTYKLRSKLMLVGTFLFESLEANDLCLLANNYEMTTVTLSNLNQILKTSFVLHQEKQFKDSKLISTKLKLSCHFLI